MAGLRISGLATGMDIDSIVQDMIRAKRVPYDKMEQQKQTLEWKRDQYREMNTLLLGLREDTLNMRMSTSFLTKTTTSSNDSKITATANSTAGNATYTFNKVERLASAATNASTDAISGTDGKIDPKASIYSLQGKFAGGSIDDWKQTDKDGVSETVKVKSAGKEFKLTKLSGGTIQDLEGKDKDENLVNNIITVTNGTNKEEFTIVDSSDNLKEDQVYVNKETGTVIFGKELKADSSFDLSYKYIHNESFTAGENQNTFSLSNAGIKGDNGIKSITVTIYETNSDGTIQKDSNGNSKIKETKTYSTNPDLDKGEIKLEYNSGKYTSADVTVDGETGEIKFTKAVDKGAKIEASYGYSYFEFDMTTHTSKSTEPVTESFKINSGDSFQSILDKISKSDLGVSAFYDEYSDRVTLTRTETGNFNPGTSSITEQKTVETDGQKTFKLNKIPTVITSDKITATKEGGTDPQIFNIVNSADNLGEDEVYINKETGELTFGTGLKAGSEFDISYEYNNPEIDFKGNSFLKDILRFDEGQERGGEDAKFTINGLETGRHSNTFEVNGMTFTLKDTFDATTSPVSIGAQTDTDKVFENIKTFIDKYNETIDKINKKIGEEYYRDYDPLTKEQREALGEKEIELWEEKAKSGLLRRDQTLTSVLDKMRNDFYSPVSFEGNSLYKQLTAIGIKTTNLYNVNKGKLEIDEDKLKEAINNDPEAIYQLFAADGDSYGEKGIARRLRDSLTTAIQSIEANAGSGMKTNSQFTIGKRLDDLEDRMSTFESRLKDYEDQYYRQFTAMETAIQKMNQQSSYMMQQLGMAMQ